MTPAEVLRAVSAMSGPSLAEREPSMIDLSEIPERPAGGDAVRGRFAHFFRTYPLVEIDADLRDAFPSGALVNDALRSLLRIARVAAETEAAADATATSSRHKKGEKARTNPG